MGFYADLYLAGDSELVVGAAEVEYIHARLVGKFINVEPIVGGWDAWIYSLGQLNRL